MRAFIQFSCACISLFLLGACGNASNQPSSDTSVQQPATPSGQQLPEEAKKPKVQYPTIKDEAKFLAKYAEENLENKVRISTRFGDIVVKLYDDTPLHRANFIMNVKYKLYDNTIFYRVVPEFMAQGGNSDNDATQTRRKNIKPYYIPSELRPQHIHKYGALAMAMSYTNNPNMESSQYSFYIVTGQIFTRNMMKATELEYEIDIPEANEKLYTSIGGTPHLDGVHTVFGEVIEGFDVLEKLENVKTDSGNWPVNDVFMTMELIE